MSLTTALPYGMRSVVLTQYLDSDGTELASTSVKLPNMQTFSFAEAEDFKELRGDDKTVTTHGSGASVEWELEAGGISPAAYAILTGAVITTSGVTPNTTTTVRKRGSTVRPYFRAEGQVISDSGGDVHAVLYRCRFNDKMSGEFKDGDFFVPNFSGVALPMLDDEWDLLYDLVFNETVTAIPLTGTTNPEKPAG